MRHASFYCRCGKYVRLLIQRRNLVIPKWNSDDIVMQQNISTTAYETTPQQEIENCCSQFRTALLKRERTSAN